MQTLGGMFIVMIVIASIHMRDQREKKKKKEKKTCIDATILRPKDDALKCSCQAACLAEPERV